MQLYYTYGKPQLLLKKRVTRYYNETNFVKDVTLEEYLKSQTMKLKGWFIPNIWLGNGPIQIKVITWKSLDRLVKTYIAAVFIDWYVVNNACSLRLGKPLASFLKKDIDLLVFNRESFITGAYAQYKEFWDKHYGFVIDNIYRKVVNEWEGKLPCEEIRNLFSNPYTYKERNRKSKWDFMKTCDMHGIAIRLICLGNIVEGNPDTAAVLAMKRNHVSVRELKKELRNIEINDRVKSCIHVTRWFMDKVKNKEINTINSVFASIDSIHRFNIPPFNALKMLQGVVPDIPCDIFNGKRLNWGPIIGDMYRERNN